MENLKAKSSVGTLENNEPCIPPAQSEHLLHKVKTDMKMFGVFEKCYLHHKRVSGKTIFYDYRLKECTDYTAVCKENTDTNILETTIGRALLHVSRQNNLYTN